VIRTERPVVTDAQPRLLEDLAPERRALVDEGLAMARRLHDDSAHR